MFLLLGYAAVGVPALGQWLLARAKRFTSLGSRRAAIAVGLAVVAALAVPKGLSSRREDAEVTRLAAEWLRDRPALHGPVAAARSRLAYYAGEEFVPLTVLERGRGIAGLIEAGACFLILDQNDLDRVARLTSLEQLRPLHRVEAEGTRAIVFALTRGER